MVRFKITLITTEFWHGHRSLHNGVYIPVKKKKNPSLKPNLIHEFNKIQNELQNNLNLNLLFRNILLRFELCLLFLKLQLVI